MKRTASIITSSAIAFFVSITGLSCIELQKRANSVFKDARFDGETHRMERVTAQADHPLQAIRTGDGYELDYQADPSVVVHKTYVTGDFRRLRDFQNYEDGLKIHTEFVVRHAEGKHFVKSLTRQALKPGVQELKNRLIFIQTHREQYIFLRRLVIEDITTSGKTFWKLELQDVTLKSTKAPSRN